MKTSALVADVAYMFVEDATDQSGRMECGQRHDWPAHHDVIPRSSLLAPAPPPPYQDR